MKKTRDKLASERGAVFNEAVIVLPILFLVLGFMVDAALALTQHELVSYSVTSIAREVAVLEREHCSEYSQEARSRLQARLRSYHIRFRDSDINSAVESIHATPPGGTATPIDIGIRVGMTASPTCVLCLFHDTLFRSNHNSLFLLEDKDCS